MKRALLVLLLAGCSERVKPLPEVAPAIKIDPMTRVFDGPRHLSVVRARFGEKGDVTHGIPVAFKIDALACGGEWYPIVEENELPGPRPTRRSWFVDADACGLRVVVSRTNGGPTIMRELSYVEGARNVLPPNGYATDYKGKAYEVAVDRKIDRVRLVLGTDATSRPRAQGGRSYAILDGPDEWRLEASDGARWETLARSDKTPVRRRLVRFAAREVKSLRLVMPQGGVVRELAAYAADDPRPVIAPMWLLSVNANPWEVSTDKPGGDLANDLYHAKFVHQRFRSLIPALKNDDRVARALGPQGELRDARSTDHAGEVLEIIEGDDPLLDRAFLDQSPPPFAILSGSNQWEFSRSTAPGTKGRWLWNPMRGMHGLISAVKGRVAPMFGICGGAQILALFEAQKDGEDDQALIDRVLVRTTGAPIRGFAPWSAVDYAWPGASDPRTRVELEDDPLFEDLHGRKVSHAFPESHADAVRPSALSGFKIIARSRFQASEIPEAFVARGHGYPIMGVQFHPEQRDFESASDGDPPESVADPFLVMAAAYEEAVDAYLKVTCSPSP